MDRLALGENTNQINSWMPEYVSGFETELIQTYSSATSDIW